MKNKFSIHLFVFLFLLVTKSFGQSEKLEDGIIEIVSAFYAKDTVAIQKYIHPDYGVANIIRPGILDNYIITKSIDFNAPIPAYLPYSTFKIDTLIASISEPLPVYDCAIEKWNKKGLYYNTNGNILSKTAIIQKEYGNQNIAKETIKTFKNLESKSYAVAHIDSDGEELLFYITLIDSKWYITVLDRVSSDYGA